ncbi:uncharacterized protein LOC123502090 [Portunus trituberculatus]|uniref:uncharacterized protein LOC123502090 n=1 Tax=Portunus trituberculatus TaxID=210409 RepID=UPI001E1D0CFF|nr:uncharacterized protein LOC123502090 [Portunus trituberculatus]
MALCRLPLGEAVDCLLSERSQQKVIKQLGHLLTPHRSQQVTRKKRGKIRRKGQDNAKTHALNKTGQVTKIQKRGEVTKKVTNQQVTKIKIVRQDKDTHSLTKTPEERAPVTKPVTNTAPVTKPDITQTTPVTKIKTVRQDKDTHSLTKTPVTKPEHQSPPVTKPVTNSTPVTKSNLKDTKLYTEPQNLTNPLIKAENESQSPAQVTRKQEQVTEGKNGAGEVKIASTRSKKRIRVKIRTITKSPSLTKLKGIKKQITRNMKHNRVTRRGKMITKTAKESNQVTKPTHTDKHSKVVTKTQPVTTAQHHSITTLY